MECTLEGSPGFKYGPTGACYKHDGTEEGKKAARALAEKQGRAIEISKHMDAATDPTYEYLFKLYQLVKGHPYIWSNIKEEVHKTARASAGGQLRGRGALDAGDGEDEADLAAMLAEVDAGSDIVAEVPKLTNDAASWEEWDATQKSGGKGGGKGKETREQKILRKADEAQAKFLVASKAEIAKIPNRDAIKNELQGFYDQGNLGQMNPKVEEGLNLLYNPKGASVLDNSKPQSVAERYARAYLKTQSAQMSIGNQRDFGQTTENYFKNNPGLKTKHEQLDIARRYFEYQGVKSDKNTFEKCVVTIRSGGRSTNSFGGDLHMMKLSNAAPTGKIVYEDDDILEVSVIPMREGVFVGTDGVATLKKYDNFAPYVHWLDGVPITPGHVAPISGEVMPSTKRKGKLYNTRPSPERRHAHAVGRYYKKELSPEQIQHLKNGQPIHGSIEYTCDLANESGEFEGKHYDRVETGNYVFYNYAEVPRAACTPADGCGILMNESVGNVTVTEPVASDDLVGSCECERKNQKKQNQSGDIDNMEKEELTKLLNESISEVMKPILDRVGAIEKKLNEAPAPVPMAEVPEFKALADSVKLLNEALPIVTALKGEQEATKLATQKAAFAKQLNAAHIEGAEFEKVWDAASKDPLGRDHYLGEHPEVRLADKQSSNFVGKILNADGSAWDMAAEQKKLYGY